MKTGKIDNFFSQDFIKWLNSYWDQIPKTDDGLRYNAEAYYEQDWNVELRKNIDDAVAKHFPDTRVTYCQLYSDYAPGGIHTDGWIDEEQPDMMYTILAPISMNYPFCSTVIFNEESEKAVSYNRATGLGDRGVVSYEQIDLPQDKTIGKDFIDVYLKHLEVDALPLTLNSVLYWNVGGAIYWPRKKFHASSWFPTENIDRKAIVIHTNAKR